MANITEERRAQISEQMKRQLADPAFMERRKAAVRAYWDRYHATGEGRDMVEAKNFKAAATRRRKGVKPLSPEVLARKADLMRRLNADPAFIEKRKRGEAKSHASVKGNIKRSMQAKLLGDQKRGFKVPARLWSEYRFLRVAKKLPAAEAGRILGLVE